MPINISVPNDQPEMKPRIAVVGVGGAGGNAVNNMIASELEGVDFIVANTDAQALAQSRTDRRIQLGVNITQGLGAGSRPDVGHAAAEEAIEQIVEHLQGANMTFITAGMGGGTGTGAAPVVARAAREMGILTVGVVTKPFHFEGIHRMRLAEAGIEEMERVVDTLIIIPNQNLFRIANEKTTFSDAFKMADDVLYSGVRGVTDLIVMPGLINLDFADIRAVMAEMGRAMMGTGEADGERRALDAAEAAIANPLLDDTTMAGATGVLINITGGPDMTLFEVDEAANRIRSEVDPEAHIIFGSTFDQSLEGKVRVSIVATGMDTLVSERPIPKAQGVADLRAERRSSTPAPLESESATIVAMRQSAVIASTDEAQADEAPVAATVTQSQTPTDAAPTPEIPSEAEVKTLSEPAPATIAATSEAEKPATLKVSGKLEASGATPALTNATPFIAPAPADRNGDQKTAAPDPYASAAIANASRPTEPTTADAPAAAKPRGPSLFERVTGTGLTARKADKTETVETPKVEPILGKSEPIAEKAAPIAPPAEEKPLVQLGGLDAASRASEPKAEEDLLDIPAFLRRQAN
jgi:cell division protein FtsZ